MRVGVILSTFNQPVYLRLVLEGYARQSRRPDRVLIADDGSDGATEEALERAARETGLSLLHIRHADRGFRKAEILNRALAASDEELLIFSDGDCVPRRDLVEGHATLSREGRFISGGYLKLSARTSAAVTLEAVRDGRLFSVRWMRARGWRPGRRAFRLLEPGRLARYLDVATPTAATWNGHNASTLRRHLVEANGFDMDMAYGGLDRALGERLENAGVRGLQARYRLPVVHLEHCRAYADPDLVARNRAIRARIRREREVRARRGLMQLTASDEVRLRALPPPERGGQASP